jgi:acetyl/propionyl-CoA carboxylase alpha subunit/acetyl-CoA carboxylase carboxyltransferase component
MFRRVLIANRGEIAVRIAKAASALGIESVGVYAAVDAQSLHTRFTTDARELGGDPVRAYLDVDGLVAVAVETGCDCVHPGYGFLSENARFAERCLAAGLAFIGPSPDTLSLFGDKVHARGLAQSLGIPIVPGTARALGSGAEARAAARSIGYPVMLKAAAGGGGRGMRSVVNESEIEAAFERCNSEAQAAFGDGSVFIEKLIERPRHIEVQVLADRTGAVTHVWERDCSVQLRNQKVVEIAPAPNLDADLRGKILDAALRLAVASNYLNAGTVEFLVSPEQDEFWFIECNPRIQVEHTVTEQASGVDLVETQFALAAGVTLASLGIGRPTEPRGFAVQARVVAGGPGTFAAYREPSGVGVRVDGNAYVGYTPAAQFDPLIAKVIGTSNSSGSYASALDRTLRALDEFHIDGVPNNLAQLRAILSDASVRAGDARTTLLGERGEFRNGVGQASSKAIDLLRRHGTSQKSLAADRERVPNLTLADGHVAVESPMAGSIVGIRATVGRSVAAGETLLVISAMKMETEVQAPCAGVIAELAALAVGASLDAGQVVAAIQPAAGRDADGARAAPWQPLLDEVHTLQRLAEERLRPGSRDPGVVRQRERGKLTCRERIALLLDSDSFHEIGSVAGFASYDDAGRIAAFTPANHVGGWGRVEGRTTVVCADDFTSRGGHADGAIGAKSFYLDRLSMELQCPSVRLLDGSSGGGSVAAMVPQQKREGESTAQESSGAITAGRPRVAGGGGSFLPGHLGSSEYAAQLATVPVVNVLLGSVVGIGAAKAVLGHFSVMVRDIAQLFVAGPPVVRHAMGYDVTKEDLGGWHIHCRNGAVDNLAETEADAMQMTRRFLSYLPSSVYEPPPVVAPNLHDSADRRDDELQTLIPRKRTSTFDIRKAIRLLADVDSFFEIGALWGTDQVVGFIRVNGYPMGVLASDSRHENGGALTADGCDKLTRHLDLCDVFHLPVLNLVDNPGFAVGIEHEVAATIRKGGEWMVAFAQSATPIFTVIMRRSFGVAGNNYATPRVRPSMRVVWPSADVGGIPPEGGIEAAYKRQLEEAADPIALRDELMARIESVRGPVGPLSRFQMEEMIDPRDTRRLVSEWLPIAYKVISQPARLQPRALQFRP